MGFFIYFAPNIIVSLKRTVKVKVKVNKKKGDLMKITGRNLIDRSHTGTTST